MSTLLRPERINYILKIACFGIKHYSKGPKNVAVKIVQPKGILDRFHLQVSYKELIRSSKICNRMVKNGNKFLNENCTLI